MHIRATGDFTLTFIVSGKLWRNSLIMQDKETGTLWSHITGEALDGDLKGEKLRMLPSVQTTWERWVGAHPTTEVLKKEQEVKGSRYQRYFNDPRRAGIFRSRWLRERLPAKTLVLGVNIGPDAVAVVEKKLSLGSFLSIPLGDVKVLIVRTSDGGERAYIARIGERDLVFPKDGSKLEVQDETTRSLWDLTMGKSIAGELRGKALEETVVRRAFWFAWSSFFPNTDVID